MSTSRPETSRRSRTTKQSSGRGRSSHAERSAAVANDIWLTAARTVFAWALSNKLIRTNPSRACPSRLPAKAQQLREREFRDNEWRIILNASLAPPPPRMSRHNAMARRWVPWLCAYTGSRPGEVTQLRAQDVQRDNGLWVMRITPEAGAVKGRRARVVPIHEHLIEQGFVKFARSSGQRASLLRCRRQADATPLIHSSRFERRG